MGRGSRASALKQGIRARHNVTMTSAASDFWPGSGLAHLGIDAQGSLLPTTAYWRHWLQRPELALADESCRAEKSLHRALQSMPLRPVPAVEVDNIADADVAHNYRHFLALRDAVQEAGSLQAWYLALFRSGAVTVPPLFIDLVTQAIVQHLLLQVSEGTPDALGARAAELFFRPQRISFEQGRVLAADSATLQEQSQTQGLGEIGRLLAQAQISAKPLDLPVLGPDNATRYWAEATVERSEVRSDMRSSLLLDLTQELKTDVGHGLQFTMNNARSGLKPLALMLQAWVQHLLGVAVTVQPVPRIDDPQWRWHVGLDAESSLLLNDLYEGHTVDDERLDRLISLFRLDFVNPAEMRRDVAGRPVYLGLMATRGGQLRLKPQNLLLNLPLATLS